MKILGEFVWPGLRVSAGCYEQDKWTCGLHKRRGVFRLKEKFLAYIKKKPAHWSSSLSLNLPVIWQTT
jgi:hypothetical protein